MKTSTNAATAGPSTSASAAARAEEALRQSSYPALWTVSCQQVDGALIMRGRVPQFYLKQLAQILVAKVLSGVQILNQIEVVER